MWRKIDLRSGEYLPIVPADREFPDSLVVQDVVVSLVVPVCQDLRHDIVVVPAPADADGAEHRVPLDVTVDDLQDKRDEDPTLRPLSP